MTSLSHLEHHAQVLNTAMAGVYRKMTFGLAITGVIAGLLASVPGLIPLLFSGILGWVIVLAPLAVSLFLMTRINSMSADQVKLAYVAFATLLGLSLSLLFYTYTAASIAQAFVVTAVSFAALSFYGYFTKRDLSGFGPWLFAGVIGLITAGIFNIFFQSGALQMVVNSLAVVIFLGLTAHDTQSIRNRLWRDPEDSLVQWTGALSLYINFINIFVSLVQLMGNRE